jgi:hypothetical protein
VSGHRCKLRLVAETAGSRRWELRLSNNRPDQAIRVHFNDRLVASHTIEDLPLDTVTRVQFEADVLAGANLVMIEADQVLESLSDPRPLAFILVDLRACDDERQTRDCNVIRWDLSRGLGEARETEIEDGSMKVRPVEQEDCTIVVERQQRGTARLLIEAVTALPAQTASLLVNGKRVRALGLSTGAAGDVVQIEREVALIAGRNTLQLRFSYSPRDDGPYPGVLMFLGEVRIDELLAGTPPALPAFAAAEDEPA